MYQELLAKLKKLPKERYRELTASLENNFDANVIKEGLAKEGVEITDEEVAYLVSILRKEAEMEMTPEQLQMVAGGKDWGREGCI